MTRVLFADDHVVVRQGVQRLLTAAGNIEVVGVAATGPELQALVLAEPADVCLLDLGMPGGSLELIATLRKLRPGLRILVFSGQAEDEMALRCLTAGAAGYVEKTASADELIDAVRTVAAGHSHVTSRTAQLLASHLTREDTTLPHERLSRREYEVFRGLAAGGSLTEIASELGISVKTASTYRTRLLEKMGLSRNAELTRYAIERRLL